MATIYDPLPPAYWEGSIYPEDAALAQAQYLGVNQANEHAALGGGNMSGMGTCGIGVLNGLLGPSSQTLTNPTISNNQTGYSSNIIIRYSQNAGYSAINIPSNSTLTLANNANLLNVAIPSWTGHSLYPPALQAAPIYVSPKNAFFSFVQAAEDMEFWHETPRPRPGTANNDINIYGMGRRHRFIKSSYDDAINALLDRRSFNEKEVDLLAFIGFLVCNGVQRGMYDQYIEQVEAMGVVFV